jgi:GTPase
MKELGYHEGYRYAHDYEGGVVAGVRTQHLPDELRGMEARRASTSPDEHLAELGRLTDTAGAEVVGTLQQRLDSPHPKYYIGEGKVGELRELIAATRRDARHLRRGAVAGAEQEPRGVAEDAHRRPGRADPRHLRDARAHERGADAGRAGAARVHAAAAEADVDAPVAYPRRHRLPRTGRDAAGDGPPADQPADRRPAREAGGRRARRATQRKGRSEEFTAALVGYTNAGKSSILRALSGADLFIEDRLFATLDPSTRAVELEPGMKALVTDTVGFIRKLPHHLVASFSATLEEAMTADVLLHAIDASHPGWEEQKEVVEDVLEAARPRGAADVLVFNKIDRLTHGEEQAFRSARRGAVRGAGGLHVRRRGGRPGGAARVLLRRCASSGPRCRLLIPYADGEALATVYREGEVLRRRRTAGQHRPGRAAAARHARPAAQPDRRRGGDA